MRKIFNIGLSLIILLLNINIVNAAECEELKMYANNDFWTKMGIYMNYNSKNVQYSLYKLKDSSQVAYSAYCRNAGVSAGKSYDGETFYCDHTVFDATSEDEMVKLYDAGIVAILKEGYSTKNPDYNNLTDDKGYAATNVALRVYEMLWPDLNTNGNNNTGLNNAHKYYVNLWLDEPEIQDLLTQTIGNVRGKFSNATTVTSWTDSSGTIITDEIINEAKKLLIKGLEAARYYKENGAASLKGLDHKPVKVKEPVVTDRRGNKTYKTSLTYTFEAEKFKSSNAYIKINFNCVECSTYGVDYTLYINDRNIGKNISNINLIRYLTNGEGKLEFKIEFSATSDTYHCEALNYKVEVEWFDETISVEAYDMYSAGCKSNVSCQHFYMLYATDVPTKKTIEDSVELCSLACKDLEAQCNQGNREACEMFEEKYHSDCAECTTYIGNAVCSENDSEIDITEGYDVDSANCGNINEDRNLNVLQCVINNEDPAGNSYKATTEGFEKVMNNEFCSVWCKEDYHFVLPGIKETNSGRYFSLQTSIKGAKTCYTSKIDEYDTFEDKLEEKRKDVIDAWNDWRHWYIGSLTATESQERTVTACCGGGTYYYTNYFREWDYDQRNYNGGTYYDDDVVRSNGSGNCSCHKVSSTCGTGENAHPCQVCGSGSCSPRDGNPQAIANTINNNLRRAESSLKAAIKAYTDLINQYNACSGENTIEYYNLMLNSRTTNGWKMDYEYDPTISFWYQESYMNSVLTDELQTIGSVNIGGFKQSFCSADTNNAYKTCSNGWKSSIDKNDTTSQFVCKQSGNLYTCGTESMIISKATYVKQEMESSGEYITPTQFYTIYPTGAIVVSEAGNEDEIENSKELTNLLPVGLGTRQGVYTYALKVKDLGEYYNKSKLGRIWGDSDSVVINVLEQAEEGNSCTKEGALQSSVKVDRTTIKDGVYVCAYKVNCPDCPVECDPDGCKRPDCPDNSCPVECDNCIYTNSSTNIGYKPITPGNINPNDREMGVNWNYNENSISTALELKAYATTTEIEKAGETIYDIDYEDTTTSVDTEFAMQVKLDTQMINLIRTYNDQYENGDGYANNTLKCYDYKNSSDGKTYDNIYCYSTFLDHIIEETGGPNTTGGSEKVKIVGGTRIFNEGERTPERIFNSGYWTTWSQANASSWTVTTQSGIAYYQKNYKEIGIGPSWK